MGSAQCVFPDQPVLSTSAITLLKKYYDHLYSWSELDFERCSAFANAAKSNSQDALTFLQCPNGS